MSRGTRPRRATSRRRRRSFAVEVAWTSEKTTDHAVNLGVHDQSVVGSPDRNGGGRGPRARAGVYNVAPPGEDRGRGREARPPQVIREEPLRGQAAAVGQLLCAPPR